MSAISELRWLVKREVVPGHTGVVKHDVHLMHKVVVSKRLQYRVSGMSEWQDVPIHFEDNDQVIESELSQFDNVSVIGACRL
jgi:hypothetical protein